MKNGSDAGQRIMALRKDRGLSREKLADLTDVSTKFIYEIEIRGVGFSSGVLKRIAKALDVSTDYILFGKVNSQYDNLLVETLGRFEPGSLKKVEELLKIVYEMVHC